MTMLAIVLTFLATQASLAAVVWAFICRERKAHNNVKDEKDAIIKAKNKLVSEAKLNRRLKSDAETVKYLEDSNDHLREIVARFDAAKSKNKELQQRADSVREIEMDNQLLGKEAKRAEDLEDINRSLKYKISRIPVLEKENDQLLLESTAAQHVEEKNVSLQSEVDRLKNIASENSKLEDSLKHLRSEQRKNHAKRNLQKEGIEDLERSNAELEEGAKHLKEQEEKKAVLTTKALRVQNLMEENSALEVESMKHSSVSAKNSELRQIAEKVLALEAENDDLEVAARELDEAQDLNEILKEEVDVDRLIALRSENVQLREQARLAVQLEGEKDLLLQKSQQVATMKAKMSDLKADAAEFQDVFQYYIALEECSHQVAKLKAVNNELEKTANQLPALKGRNAELKSRSNIPCEDRELSSLLEDNKELKEKSNSAWRLKAENKLLADQCELVDELKARLATLKEQGKGVHRLQAEINLLQQQAAHMERMKEEKEALKEKIACLKELKQEPFGKLTTNEKVVTSSLDEKVASRRNIQSVHTKRHQANARKSMEKILLEEDCLRSPLATSSCAYGSFTSELVTSIAPMRGTMGLTAPGCEDEHLAEANDADESLVSGGTKTDRVEQRHLWKTLSLLPFLAGFQSKVSASRLDQSSLPSLSNSSRNSTDNRTPWQKRTKLPRKQSKNSDAQTRPEIDAHMLSHALDSFGSRFAGSNRPLF